MQVFALITFPVFVFAFIIAIGSSNVLLATGLVLLLYASFKLARGIGQRNQGSTFQEDSPTASADPWKSPMHEVSETPNPKLETTSSASFSQPRQVVLDEDLTLAQKGVVLREWECDEQALARAANEGMSAGTGRRPRLAAVKAAQARLKELGQRDSHPRAKAECLTTR